MLSRTADDVFWAARYVERAENLARLLEVADRMSMMPAESDNSQEWQSVLTAGGVAPGYNQTHDEVTAEAAIDFIAFDQNNPSSIHNCIRAARENVRAQRHAVTREFWEAINGAWQMLRDQNAETLASDGLSNFIDDVKRSSHMVRGALAGTMIRDDLYHFIRLGTFLERADSTARILDVKYHLILPARKPLGGATDYYHWTSLLQSVSAHGSYRRIFGEAVESRRVAELLTVRPEMPRSVRACYDEIMEHLQALSNDYGIEFKSLSMAGRLYAEIRYNAIEDILSGKVIQGGLHEFLTDVIERNAKIVEQFQQDFLLAPAVEEALS